jgi:hypothetical protein
MNETPFEKSQNSDDELQPEYRFDYQKAKPNRFAARNGTQQLTVVVLDEDVAQSTENLTIRHRSENECRDVALLRLYKGSG